MTDERYLWWSSEIAKARASDDKARLSTLQLDYNLELGSCLAHQSQRTKDIISELSTVHTELEDVSVSVGALTGRVKDIENTVTAMAASVTELATSVKRLVTFHRDADMKVEGVKTFWNTVGWVAGGVAAVVGWGYAIYQALH